MTEFEITKDETELLNSLEINLDAEKFTIGDDISEFLTKKDDIIFLRISTLSLGNSFLHNFLKMTSKKYNQDLDYEKRLKMAKNLRKELLSFIKDNYEEEKFKKYKKMMDKKGGLEYINEAFNSNKELDYKVYSFMAYLFDVKFEIYILKEKELELIKSYNTSGKFSLRFLKNNKTLYEPIAGMHENRKELFFNFKND